MPAKQISVSDGSKSVAKKIVDAHSSPLLDSGLAVKGQGVDESAAAPFAHSLDTYALGIRKKIAEIREALLYAEKSITDTLNDLAESDETLAAEAATFNAGVEDIPAPNVAGGASSGTISGSATGNTSTGAASGAASGNVKSGSATGIA